MINIPNDVNLIFEVFNKSNLLCYGVGGWIRDSIMGNQTFDIDLCTEATPDKLMQLFASYSPKPMYPYGIQFTKGDYTFEITTMRIESTDSDGRHPNTIQYTKRIEDDVKRRDFTINGLYYSPRSGLIDLVGGLQAIKNRELVVIGDPSKRFNEDYVRILRLMMFQSRFGFKVEKNAREASANLAHKMNSVSRQQVSTYLTKILLGANVLTVFENFKPVFLALIPELSQSISKTLVGNQGTMNLYEYLTKVTHSVKLNSTLKYAALFHKIGLVNCTCDGDGLSELCSNSESQSIAKKYLDKFQINKKKQKQILKLIEMHDLDLKLNPKSMQRFIFEYGRESVDDFVEFQRCINTVLELEDISQKQIDLYREVIDNKLPLSQNDLSLSLEDLVATGIPIVQANTCLQYAFIAYLSGKIEDNPGMLIEFCMEVNYELYSRY